MRILMTAGVYTSGGSSVVIENLAEKLCNMGVEVTVCALMFKQSPTRGSYDVCRLNSHNLSRLKRARAFDIIHNHHPIMNYLDLISHIPFVFHYHGVPNFGKGSLFRFSMLSSVKMTNHRFDAAIAISETGYAELKKLSGLSKIHVIYNGVNTDMFRPRLVDDFRKGTPQYLFVGNLYEHKNVEELIYGMKELVKIYPKAHLQIVGDGYASSKLKRLVCNLQVQDHVSFVGYVPYDRLPDYYNSCDVYVTASKSELFSLPLLEAWACGKVVLASAIPAHIELIRKARAGMSYALGNVGDLVRKMAYDYEHASKLIGNGVRFAKDNDWSKVADRVLQIYSSVG